MYCCIIILLLLLLKHTLGPTKCVFVEVSAPPSDRQDETPPEMVMIHLESSLSFPCFVRSLGIFSGSDEFLAFVGLLFCLHRDAQSIPTRRVQLPS